MDTLIDIEIDKFPAPTVQEIYIVDLQINGYIDRLLKYNRLMINLNSQSLFKTLYS